MRLLGPAVLLVLSVGACQSRADRPVTCAQVRCRGGTTCVEDSRGARCESTDPCAEVSCPYGSRCVAVDGGTACEPSESACAKVSCAAGEVCLVAADGRGLCQKRVQCGGLSGARCPGGGQCVDDPTDGCEASRGGRDCGGLCQCLEPAVPCQTGTRFDADPTVCACLPP